MFVTPSSRTLRKRGVRGPGLIPGSGPSAFQSGAGSRLSNLGLAVSASGSALTIALKGADGNDPSASNPVDIDFRNATGTAGTPSTLSITSATSLVVSSGSTLGVSSSTAFRLWVVGFNDGGTFRLGVVNCRSGSSVMALCEWALYSSTAEGGAGAADSAQVIYTGTAVSSKALRILGFVEWNTSGVTAGTWTTANLSDVQIKSSAMPGPGQSTGNQSQTLKVDTFSGSSTSLSDITGLSASITPISAANLVKVQAKVSAATDTAASAGALALIRASTNVGGGTALSNRISAFSGLIRTTDGNSHQTAFGEVLDAPQTASSVTYKVQFMVQSAGTLYVNRSASDSDVVGVGARCSSSVTLEEIMA